MNEAINEIENNVIKIPKSFIGNGIDINKVMGLHKEVITEMTENKKCYDIKTQEDILKINMIIMQKLAKAGSVKICIK
jgi:GTP:adenosylcobinamide-phosphate guanylyltransferase